MTGHERTLMSKHLALAITLSVLGCVVNGPGEALMTDIGITGGGKGSHMVFLAGKTDHHTDSEKLVDHVVELVEKRAADLAAARKEKA